MVLQLCLPFKKIQQLRVAYMAAKRDNGLITMTTSQLLADVTAAVCCCR
jgi:hypothetical protein